jgi:diguanylate cyclase (GGDEF)-like protein
MARTILISGAAKADCLRIRDVLRRQFKHSVIQVNEDSDLFPENQLTVATRDRSGDPSEGSEELQRKILRAEFLLEAARLLSAPELDKALWDVVEKSKEVLGSTALVFLLEESEPELRCAASTQPEQLPIILESLVNVKGQVKAKLQDICRSGQAELITDLSSLNLPDELQQMIGQFGLMSLMAIPIKKDDEVYGVFITISSAPNIFEQSQLIVSVELSQAMARAICHARVIALLEQKANTDGLTGIYNRRFFDEVLQREVARAERHRLPLVLLMLDVDDFKQVNELYGHQAGDNALRALATILQSSVRREDFVFRYGGDEFAILLPDTGMQGGQHVGEHIRSRVESAGVAASWGMKVTVSIGVSEHELSVKEADAGDGPAKGRTLEEAIKVLVSRSDEALLNAKKDRKNKVETYKMANGGK